MARTLEEMTRQAFVTGRLAAEHPSIRVAHLGLKSSLLDTPVQQIIRDLSLSDSVRGIVLANGLWNERERSVSAIVHAHKESETLRRSLFQPEIMRQAAELSKIAESFVLPNALASWRTPTELFAEKMVLARSFAWAREPTYLAALSQVSAASDLLASSVRVDLELRAGMLAFARERAPAFTDLAAYRHFLDIGGLNLSRWPRRRLLTATEKRRRLRARLKENTEPPHRKRAKSLVHRYELTLSQIIDAMMAEFYGEDWAEERLPLCGCKGLLGKWKARGGDVLDHADYTDFALIMSDPDHFADVFEVGFDDPGELKQLMLSAGRLRAASHHAGRIFTPEDLRDLRVTWLTIETGLVALSEEYVLEF